MTAAGLAAAPAAKALAQTTSYKEAPALTQLVQQRRVPPIEQRLPKEPVVVKPVDRVGQYGGVWRMATLGLSDGAWFFRTAWYDSLTRWDPDWNGPMPNLATKWDVSPDGTTFTFTLREGVKWSDGQPFTADDLEFYYKDVFLNKDLVTSYPAWLTANKEPAVIEKVDTYTVRFRFSAPAGLFLQNLSSPDSHYTSGVEGPFLMPAHYMKQWLTAYNKANVDAAIAREQLTDARAVFNQKNDPRTNPDRPMLSAWVQRNILGQGQRFTMERNPFYWKVDTAGNQLPYIDRIEAELYERTDTMVLRALNGEIDMQDRHIATLPNKSVFFDNQDKGNYTFFDTVGVDNPQMIQFNLAHRDPEFRRIFQDKRFRVAMSHAINRQEAIDILYVGQTKPAQTGSTPGLAFHHDQLTNQYLEYSPATADALLDEMGLTRRDGRGMRLRLDGSPFTINFEVSASTPTSIEYLELVKKWWANVGIDMNIVSSERALFYQRKDAGDHDAAIWGGADGAFAGLLDPRSYLPFSLESLWATPWARWWNSNGLEGEEPIEVAKYQQELYDKMRVTASTSMQRDIYMEILQIAADNFWAIGLCTAVPGYGIVRKDFFNVPKRMIGSWQYPTPGPVNPQQFFTTRRA